jgi:hypothetical protein
MEPSQTRRSSKLSVLLLQLIAGISYTALQIGLIRVLSSSFGDATTDAGRALTVFFTTSISVAVLFAANRYILKTPPLMLGVLAGASFFTYFYFIHSPLNPLTTILMVVGHWRSLVVMLLATLGPVLIGALLRPNNSFKPTPLRGAA